MKTLKILMAIVLLSITQSLMSQVEWSGELRFRPEYRDGYNCLPDSSSHPAFITSQRARINANFQRDDLNVYFSLQDVRVWGEQKLKEDLPSVALYQGWAEYNFSEYFALKAGRQEFVYDNERLLSNTNWNNVATTHDAFLVKFKNNSGLDVHLAGAYNNDEDKNFESNYPVKLYKTLSFVWISKSITDNLKVKALSICDGNQKANTDYTIYMRNTSGLGFDFKNDSLGVEAIAEGYYQLGKNAEGTEIGAYFFSATAGYQLLSKLKVLGEIDYFSGNNQLDTAEKKIHAFNNLFSSGHKYLGYMDYFTTVDKHTNNTGVTDIMAKIEYKANKKLKNELCYHYFLTSGKLLNPEITSKLEAYDAYLASEIDFVFDYSIAKPFNIKGGYSVLFGKEPLQALKGGDYKKYSNWAWMMLTFKL